MPIIKWQPFKDLNQHKFEPDDFFAPQEEWVPFVPTFKVEEPAMDVYQDKDNFYVEMPLSGISPEKVEISVENHVLTVSGQIEEKKEEKGKQYLKKEIRRGSFQRSMRLPSEVKGDKATAESKNGILKITIPKTQKASSQAKRIPIKIK
jgi:HSP20 family protein